MVWIKLDSDTLSSAADTISSVINGKKFMQLITHVIDNASALTEKLTFDQDTGSKYSWRQSESGTADTTEINQANINLTDAINGTFDFFFVNVICNISGEEVLMISHGVNRNTAGAGTAPQRQELVGKFTDTTVLTKIDVDNDAAGSFDIDSNSTVLGTD